MDTLQCYTMLYNVTTKRIQKNKSKSVYRDMNAEPGQMSRRTLLRQDILSESCGLLRTARRIHMDEKLRRSRWSRARPRGSRQRPFFEM